jgi:hypothetical protein
MTPEKRQQLINIFAKFGQNSNGIPEIKSADWQKIIHHFHKNDVKEAFAAYITENKIPFPFREVSIQNVKDAFIDLYSNDLSSVINTSINPKDIAEKYKDYNFPFHKYGKFTLQAGWNCNIVSDYFQQKNRMLCGHAHFNSPMDTWTKYEFLKKFNWPFYRDLYKDIDITRNEYLTGMQLGGYIASQFKPLIAKGIYTLTNARNVLDTSCGWGDRLAGFYGTPNTELYVGCDPNENTFEVYKEQCRFYESMLNCDNPVFNESTDFFECIGKKHVKIYRKPAEEMTYEDTFDCMFTSPPYFMTEKYNETGDNLDDQSWKRYDTYEKWRDNFLFKMIDNFAPHISDDGYVMINIVDAKIKNKRYKICDDMVDYMQSIGLNFIGQGGMMMSHRPQMGQEKVLNFIENIWCFSKQQTKFNYQNTLINDFFDNDMNDIVNDTANGTISEEITGNTFDEFFE